MGLSGPRPSCRVRAGSDRWDGVARSDSLPLALGPDRPDDGWTEPPTRTREV